MLNEIVNGFIQLANNYGVVSAVIIFAIGSHYWLIFWLIKKGFNSRDREIDRIAENRDKLQGVILKQVRLSTKGGKK